MLEFSAFIFINLVCFLVQIQIKNEIIFHIYSLISELRLRDRKFRGGMGRRYLPPFDVL